MHILRLLALLIIVGSFLVTACSTSPPVGDHGGVEEEQTAQSQALDECRAGELSGCQPTRGQCDDIEDDGARTDCVARDAAAREGLSSLERHELCIEAPFPLRCHYMLALEFGEAHSCHGDREKVLWRYYHECQLLRAMEEGDTRRCAQVLEEDRSLQGDSELVTVCERIARAERLLDMALLQFDELPTDGDGLYELLAPYYVAMAYETHLYLLERERIYDGENLAWSEEDYEMWGWDVWDPAPPTHGWIRLVEIDLPMAAQFAELFTPTFGRDPSFHVELNLFDPETWDGLEQMLTAIRLYGRSGHSHVPQDTLTFQDDGTYQLRERISTLDDHAYQRFELHEGNWEIQSAVPGERWAIITLDEESYGFGICDGYILHPVEELSEDIYCGDAHYSTFEYVGEA